MPHRNHGRDDPREHAARAQARIGTELVPGLRLSRLLAVGQLGAVYVGEGHRAGKVAVKVVHPELAHDLGRELLKALAQAADVGHALAVAPIELLITDTARAVVTRLIVGESLAELTTRRRGRIPPSEALRITRDTLELIGTAHAHDVCHGALSLSHILLDDQGAPHVIGFGEARVRAHLGLVPDRMFLAPGHNPSSPSVTADLWAVGALLFVLLTGTSPRDERSDDDVRRIRSLAQVTDHAPKALVELVDRTLASDPARRWPDAGTLLAAVQQISQSREIQYAHPLGSALAAESGSHAWLDPARVTQPPQGAVGWSSTPPVRPHATPPQRVDRPASKPPEAPRSRLEPSLPAATQAEDPLPATPPPARAPEPPRVVNDALATQPRGTTSPSGTLALPKPPAERRKLTLQRLELCPLAQLSAEERAALTPERNKIVALLSFDASLSLEDAWRTAREKTRPGGDFESALRTIEHALSQGGEGLSELAVQLSAVSTADPDRLVHVTASSLEGPALGPSLEAFGPALREHVHASLEHEPHTALRLLLMLHNAVRAPSAMLPAERRRVLDAIATPGLVKSLYSRLGARVSDPHALDGLASLLPSLGPVFAAELGAALPQISDLSLQAKVLHHLEAELTGHEHALGELARTTDPHLGIEVARILARIDTLAARDALATAALSPHAVVRIEALGLCEGATGENLRRELKRRLEDAPGTERIHTLRALADYEVRVAVPFLALRLKSPHVDSLPFEERRSLFHALCVLAPARAETLALEILGHKKLLSTGAHEETRALAASALGEIGASEDALEALSHHAERHFGTSDRVRHAALQARDAVHLRMSSGRRAEPRPSHPPPRATRPPPRPSEAPHRPSEAPGRPFPPDGRDRGKK